MGDLVVPTDFDGLRTHNIWEENQTNLQKIRPFISAVDLTIPSGPSEDLQSHEFDAAKIYGRITIPILAQNATFTENNSNWNALEVFAPTLEKFLCVASKVLKDDLEENFPTPQGRPRNDYKAALEICQRALPADQGGMPLVTKYVVLIAFLMFGYRQISRWETLGRNSNQIQIPELVDLGS
ncbi:uncharacterized protein Bfra_003364 [Botrytis fragariae]|uniref:Uncharacterized protein n=1 Tax=Botrytis fragariae TaxID=1964551 RepID=A0A8H6AW78_9HELO|nr:uncharacterized protein Bfra_003364 [Botrytis fragariae]KAF5874913.1 hypothetical protein Bfra_003364 [Botrytis fragariae]